MNAGYYSEGYDSPPPPSIWHRLNRVLWVLLILTVVVSIIGAFRPELEKQKNERDERARLLRLINEQRTLHTHYEHQIGWIQNDPDYLAVLIRDKFDLMRPGETILRVEPAKSPALTPEAPVAPLPPHLPRR